MNPWSKTKKTAGSCASDKGIDKVLICCSSGSKPSSLQQCKWREPCSVQLQIRFISHNFRATTQDQKRLRKSGLTSTTYLKTKVCKKTFRFTDLSHLIPHVLEHRHRRWVSSFPFFPPTPSSFSDQSIKSISVRKSGSPQLSQASASAKSGSTPPNKPKSGTPTPARTSRNSSKMAGLSLNPPLSTRVLAPVIYLRPSEREGILARVRGRVRRRLGCRLRCFGCGDRGF